MPLALKRLVSNILWTATLLPSLAHCHRTETKLQVYNQSTESVFNPNRYTSALSLVYASKLSGQEEQVSASLVDGWVLTTVGTATTDIDLGQPIKVYSNRVNAIQAGSVPADSYTVTTHPRFTPPVDALPNEFLAYNIGTVAIDQSLFRSDLGLKPFAMATSGPAISSHLILVATSSNSDGAQPARRYGGNIVAGMDNANANMMSVVLPLNHPVDLAQLLCLDPLCFVLRKTALNGGSVATRADRGGSVLNSKGEYWGTIAGVSSQPNLATTLIVNANNTEIGNFLQPLITQRGGGWLGPVGYINNQPRVVDADIPLPVYRPGQRAVLDADGNVIYYINEQSQATQAPRPKPAVADDPNASRSGASDGSSGQTGERGTPVRDGPRR